MRIPSSIQFAEHNECSLKCVGANMSSENKQICARAFVRLSKVRWGGVEAWYIVFNAIDTKLVITHLLLNAWHSMFIFPLVFLLPSIPSFFRLFVWFALVFFFGDFLLFFFIFIVRFLWARLFMYPFWCISHCSRKMFSVMLFYKRYEHGTRVSPFDFTSFMYLCN